MVLLLPYIFLPTLLLASLTPFSISGIDVVTSNTSLGDTVPAWGPQDFKCNVVGITVPLQAKDVLSSVIKLLENITQEDFNSRMPQARSVFCGDHNVAIAISSYDPAQPIFRRCIIWALSRIMVTMERTIGFRAGRFEPEFQGRKLGIITFTAGSNNRLSSGYAILTLESPAKSQASTNMTTMVGDDMISWIFEPNGHLMTQVDVAMGTIGTLSAAAQHSNHNFDRFQGEFDTYCAGIFYRSRLQPSLLSKKILIRTITAAALWALGDGDFHELRVRVILAGIPEIARGGYQYIPYWPPPLDNNSTATS